MSYPKRPARDPHKPDVRRHWPLSRNRSSYGLEAGRAAAVRLVLAANSAQHWGGRPVDRPGATSLLMERSGRVRKWRSGCWAIVRPGLAPPRAEWGLAR